MVDRFLVIESCKTHSGLPKEPLLRNLVKVNRLNLERSILEKLKVHTIEDFPPALDNWGRERFQRDIALNLVRAAYKTDDHAVSLLVSDLDELPNPEMILRVRQLGRLDRILPITMWQCYFRPNFVRIKGDEKEWSGPFIAPMSKASEMLSLSQMREIARQKKNFSREPLGRYQGWHLSYQGDEVFIQQKLRAFAHQEDRVQKASISVEKLIQSRRGPFDDPNITPQWAIFPAAALGMPDQMEADPFIRARLLEQADNLGRVLLSEHKESQTLKCFQRYFRIRRRG
jgi:hypothetical protein